MQLIPSYALPLPSSFSLPLLSIWLVPLDDDAPIQYLDENKTLNLSFEFLYLMEFSINHLHYAWATEECGYSLHIPSFVSCTRSIFTLLNTYFILSLLLLPSSLLFLLSLPLLFCLLPLTVFLSLAVCLFHLVGSEERNFRSYCKSFMLVWGMNWTEVVVR